MLSHTEPRSRIFGLFELLVLALLTTPAVPLAGQTLDIKLMDGRTGRPMIGASSYVNVWVGGERKEAIAIPVDGNGIAQLQFTRNPNEVNVPISNGRDTIVAGHPVVEYDASFRINVPYVMCGAGPRSTSWLQLQTLATTEVLSRGYVSANTCGKVTIPAKPGGVVLFVRPLTLWEKLKQ